jgi:hypothetical protein
MPQGVRAVAVCLVVVVLGLLAVGVVSHTLLRHSFQVIPVVVALLGVSLRTAWGKPAALGVFTLWFLIMFLIWLFLLGMARIVTGHYTPAEIVLTIVIAVASIIGFAAGLRLPRATGRGASLAVALVFFLLAFSAIWLTYHVPFMVALMRPS